MLLVEEEKWLEHHLPENLWMSWSSGSVQMSDRRFSIWDCKIKSGQVKLFDEQMRKFESSQTRSRGLSAASVFCCPRAKNTLISCALSTALVRWRDGQSSLWIVKDWKTQWLTSHFISIIRVLTKLLRNKPHREISVSSVAVIFYLCRIIRWV